MSQSFTQSLVSDIAYWRESIQWWTDAEYTRRGKGYMDAAAKCRRERMESMRNLRWVQSTLRRLVAEETERDQRRAVGWLGQ
jgi:hypothetical protein